MLDDDAAVHHVLMTADAAGGVWTYAIELVRQLARLGVHTTLATMGEPLRRRQREAAAQIPGLQVAESGFKLEWMEEPWHDVALAGDWLRALEERLRPDIIHLNGYAHAAIDWRVPRVIAAQSCVLSWWKAVLGEQPPSKYARYQREVRRGLRAADAVVTPTRAMLASLREHYGAILRGAVISNGVEPSQFSVSRKEPFVLAAGRIWDQAKNLGALAAVAPHLHWPVYLAGSSRHATGSKGRPKEIQTLGWLEPAELRDFMSRASIYAFPARYEPFGLSVLEAASSGCALVLGDVASLREVWGDAALFAPPEDLEALLAAIERLVHDDLLRARMSSAARQRALNYTAERMARRYVALYRDLASRRSACGSPRPAPARRSEGGGSSTVKPCA